MPLLGCDFLLRKKSWIHSSRHPWRPGRTGSMTSLWFTAWSLGQSPKLRKPKTAGFWFGILAGPA
jgi:hypothetical protein